MRVRQKGEVVAKQPYLSVVIPAYNEARRIGATLKKVTEYLEGQEYTSEILVVDDGSQDQTVAVVAAFGVAHSTVRVIRNEVNRGKGAVVQQGMLEARGQYRLFMDADSSTGIGELEKLLTWVKEADVVFGSRYLTPGSVKIPQPLKRRILSRSSNWLIQRLALSGVRDTQCGFKLFTVDAAEAIFPLLTQGGWLFDVELLVIARDLGFRIREVAVDWTDAAESKLRASRAAKKSLQELWRIRRQRAKGMYRRS